METYLKTVIVDDEIWIGESLRQLLDWEAEGFQVAGVYTDPLEALSEIREIEPDLLLLDIRMPQMSGEKIMELVREDGLNCQFIVVSAYGDFSVAKNAISLGAVGYVLKPVSKADLLNAVRRAKEILSKKVETEPNDPLEREIIWKKAFEGMEPDLTYGYYALVSRYSDKPVRISQENGAISLPVKIHGNRKLQFFIPDSEVMPDWSEWNRLCETQDISIGCSLKGKKSEDYAVLFKQAACAFFGAELFNRNVFAVYEYADMDFVKRWTKELLEDQTDSEISRKLEDLRTCWERGINPTTVALLVTELSRQLLFQLDREENQMQDKLVFQDFFSSFQKMEEVFQYLEDILLRQDCQAAKDLMVSSGLGSKIKRYIEAHYQDRLSLQELSSQFFLSSSYISDIFKKTNGCTITSYIAKVRMEKAADLLRKTDWSLVRIADETGYDDYNYFCRMFKKFYQVSPNSFRHKKG